MAGPFTPCTDIGVCLINACLSGYYCFKLHSLLLPADCFHRLYCRFRNFVVVCNCDLVKIRRGFCSIYGQNVAFVQNLTKKKRTSGCIIWLILFGQVTAWVDELSFLSTMVLLHYLLLIYLCKNEFCKAVPFIIDSTSIQNLGRLRVSILLFGRALRWFHTVCTRQRRIFPIWKINNI